MNKSHLIVVDSSVLPEVILKVLQVKKIMANKEAKSSAAACKLVGVSRSAYYKYRDCVYSYEEKLMQKIITLYMLLKDENRSTFKRIGFTAQPQRKYTDCQSKHSY